MDLHQNIRTDLFNTVRMIPLRFYISESDSKLHVCPPAGLSAASASTLSPQIASVFHPAAPNQPPNQPTNRCLYGSVTFSVLK